MDRSASDAGITQLMLAMTRSIRRYASVAAPYWMKSGRPRRVGPLKPVFGLSGAVLPLDKVFPLLVRVFVPSIRIRSRLVPHTQLRSGENCSTPSPQDVRTTRPSPDSDEYSAAFSQTVGSCEC